MSGTRVPVGMDVGESRLGLLDALKRRGELTLTEARHGLGLSVGTLREHMNALAADGYVTRKGTRRAGPGRPEVVYALTAKGQDLFPHNARETLSALVEHLLNSGHDALLREFFDHWVERRLVVARKRMKGLRGRARLEEIARVMSEEGFMADVVPREGSGEIQLRLCNCPLRAVVAKSQVPCHAELRFLEALSGSPLGRTSFMPLGGTSCSYGTATGRS